jgi:dolichol kinase
VFFLIVGTLSYTYMEYLRLFGVRIPLISSLTNMASRQREMGKFVMGPVTLGIGALVALLLYPYPVAAIALYVVAFGDGFASLVGKFLGIRRPNFLHGKSVEGCLACFTAALSCAYGVSHSVSVAITVAFTAMIVEALPLDDYDNLALPITVGFAAQLAML